MGSEVGRDNCSRPGRLPAADGADGPELLDRFPLRTSDDRRGGVEAGTRPLAGTRTGNLHPRAHLRSGRSGFARDRPQAPVRSSEGRTSSACGDRERAQEQHPGDPGRP